MYNPPGRRHNRLQIQRLNGKDSRKNERSGPCIRVCSIKNRGLMITPELFIFFVMLTALLFAANLFGIGAEYWIDVLCGLLSSVFMIVLTVLFAAGNVGYTIYTTTLETVLIQDTSIVFLMGAVCVFFIGFTLFKVGTALTTTYRTGGY